LAADWDGLDHGRSPFLRHGFLRALEESGSVGRDAGWVPIYLLAETDGGELAGAVVAYIKSHSYGEYIFDWGWAEAAMRAGVAYYPKLVVAVPATPATGKRILIAPGFDADQVTEALAAGVRAVADEAECSSIHWLFCEADESKRLESLGFSSRATYQFHWHNRGWKDWDDYLGALRSRRRKQMRKERRRGRESIDELRFVPGGELDAQQLESLDRYYRKTVGSHWGEAYLRPGFFSHLARYLPEHVLFADAVKDGRSVAGALFLETKDALYGRYWGCDEELDFLRFEVAYYAGIERCIERETPLFEAGAQGEHKLLRGFMPARTYSNHWIRHRGLAGAIGRHLEIEDRRVAEVMERLAEAGPFKNQEES